MAAPAAARQANAPAQQDRERWRPEAERQLVPCEQYPATEPKCRSAQRMFLDAYRKAVGGQSGLQNMLGLLLSVDLRVPPDLQSYVVVDPTEACAWGLVAAASQPSRAAVPSDPQACQRLSPEIRQGEHADLWGLVRLR